MIRIGSSTRTEKREFSLEETKEIFPIWERLTKQASERSLLVTSYYGHMDTNDPERSILKYEIGEIIQAWAEDIRRLGGEPRELWTIVWTEEGEKCLWRLNAETYAG